MSANGTIASLIALDAGDHLDDEERGFERTVLVGELVSHLAVRAQEIAPDVALEDITEWLHRRSFLPGDTVEGLLEEWQEATAERAKMRMRPRH